MDLLRDFEATLTAEIESGIILDRVASSMFEQRIEITPPLRRTAWQPGLTAKLALLRSECQKHIAQLTVCKMRTV